jgi:hypothetical protein
MCHARLSENDIILCDLPEPHGAREEVCARNLSTASRDRLFRDS